MKIKLSNYDECPTRGVYDEFWCSRCICPTCEDREIDAETAALYAAQEEKIKELLKNERSV